MVQVRELDPRNASEVEYEDVNGSDYTDTEESPTNALLHRFIPTWVMSGRWSTKLWGRLRHLGRVTGNLAWIFTTTMLLIGLPVLFAYDREKAIQEQQLMGLPGPASTN